MCMAINTLGLLLLYTPRPLGGARRPVASGLHIITYIIVVLSEGHIRPGTKERNSVQAFKMFTSVL